MAGVRAGKPGNFHVVAHEILQRRQRTNTSLKILFLVVPARSPGEYASDVEILAANVAHHVGRRNTLRGR